MYSARSAAANGSSSLILKFVHTRSRIRRDVVLTLQFLEGFGPPGRDRLPVLLDVSCQDCFGASLRIHQWREPFLSKVTFHAGSGDVRRRVLSHGLQFARRASSAIARLKAGA